MPLKIVASPQKFHGIFSRIHVCKDHRDKTYLFKEVKDSKIIANELLAYKLAKLAEVKVLPFLKSTKIGRKQGLLMPYLKQAKTLVGYKKLLNKKQFEQLQKMILFDIFIGNSDRHLSNILVHKGNLIAFDHERLFKKSDKGSSFIKSDLGRKMDKDFIGEMEKLLMEKSQLNTKQALVKIFNFKIQYFRPLEKIPAGRIKDIVKNKGIYEYLVRRKNFSSLGFI